MTAVLAAAKPTSKWFPGWGGASGRREGLHKRGASHNRVFQHLRALDRPMRIIDEDVQRDTRMQFDSFVDNREAVQLHKICCHGTPCHHSRRVSIHGL